jgi:16S rRNA (uracil1498-N3)-methyltransferase
MVMRRFYAPIESFIDDRVILGIEETRHLRDVVRLREGETISVFDGAGREYECCVDEIGKRSTSAVIVGPIDPLSPESPLDLTLAAALLKGDKFDLVVQKAVELGVTRLVPLLTTRCEVKAPPESRFERWRRISLEATKQSGRAAIMKVTAAVGLSEVLTDSQSDLVLFSERSGRPLATLPNMNRITAMVGPEGGWDDKELSEAERASVTILTLGERILRAETAAIAVSAILQNRFGDLN